VGWVFKKVFSVNWVPANSTLWITAYGTIILKTFCGDSFLIESVLMVSLGKDWSMLPIGLISIQFIPLLLHSDNPKDIINTMQINGIFPVNDMFSCVTTALLQ
jgi:hypothetical protein